MPTEGDPAQPPPIFAGIFWGLKFKKQKNIYIFSQAWLAEFDLLLSLPCGSEKQEQGTDRE